MNRQQSIGKKGFTLIELLIASTVFAAVLLICTTGLIQIGRVYYKGIMSSKTQEAARSIIDEITRAIQFTGGTVTSIQPIGTGIPPSASNFFCIDDRRFSFLLGEQLLPSTVPITVPSDETHRALVVDDSAACLTGQDLNNPGALSPTSRELLTPNMRLAKLVVCIPDGLPPSGDCTSAVKPPVGSNLYYVSIRVVYGFADFLTATKDECKLGLSSSQFCAVSELSTTVQKRLQ